jgi:hypothetical protein
MKTLIAIFLSLQFLTVSTVYTSDPASGAIHMLNSRQKDQFVFKAGKMWKGANVEIVAASGEVVAHQKLNKRRMTIDFKDVQTGTYTIKISKGNKVENFKFFRH